MALDYSKLSNQELEALANNDFSKLSDSTLQAIMTDSSMQVKPQPTQEIPQPDQASLIGAIAPAATAYGYSMPTGLGELGSKVVGAVEPFKQAGTNVLQSYSKTPLKAVADMTAVHFGMPPPYAAATAGTSAWDAVKAGFQSAKNFSQALEKLPESVLTKITPSAEYLNTGLLSKDLNKLDEAINLKGAKKAFEEFKLPNYLKNIPEAQTALNDIKNAFPTTTQKIGQVLGPIARGTARVAGPVGMAANLYEAYPYMQQAGPELTTGRAQNRMQQAQQMMLNAPTPAPLTPVEASNLLSSNDERLINIYGGRKKLSEIINSGIQAKAAEKVFGPVVPMK